MSEDNRSDKQALHDARSEELGEAWGEQLEAQFGDWWCGPQATAMRDEVIRALQALDAELLYDTLRRMHLCAWLRGAAACSAQDRQILKGRGLM